MGEKWSLVKSQGAVLYIKFETFTHSVMLFWREALSWGSRTVQTKPGESIKYMLSLYIYDFKLLSFQLLEGSFYFMDPFHWYIIPTPFPSSLYATGCICGKQSYLRPISYTCLNLYYRPISYICLNLYYWYFSTIFLLSFILLVLWCSWIVY